MQLLQELTARVGNGGGDLGGEQAGLVGIFRGEFGGFAVQVDAEGEDARPVGGFELRGESSEHSGQDVAGAAFCEAGIAGRVDKDLAVWSGDDGVRAFENDLSIPAARGILRGLDAIFLHIFC